MSEYNEDRTEINLFIETRSEKIFRALYRKYTPSLYRLAVSLTSSEIVIAEDIVQETWARAVERLGGFSWQSSFKTWITGILINCFREYRRKMPISRITLHEIENIVSSDMQLKNETTIDLKQALNVLPSGYREVLILHDLEGYKHEEIGTMLGISEGTSKSQLFRARKAIQELLM